MGADLGMPAKFPVLEAAAWEDGLRGGGPRLVVVSQRTGRGQVGDGDWHADLGQGDLALFVEARGGASTQANQRMFRFSMPASAALLDLMPATLPAAHPACGLLVSIAESFASVQHALDETLAEKLQDAFSGMLLAVFEAGQKREPSLPRLARYHIQRIKDFILRNLRNPELRVSDIARELDLSLSHMHRLFSREGCTVAEWLWAERLKNCAAELSGPSNAHQGVGEIALSWGFSDISHFSRAFKKRYGMSPKEWRSKASWRAPLAK